MSTVSGSKTCLKRPLKNLFVLSIFERPLSFLVVKYSKMTTSFHISHVCSFVFCIALDPSLWPCEIVPIQFVFLSFVSAVLPSANAEVVNVSMVLLSLNAVGLHKSTSSLLHNLVPKRCFIFIHEWRRKFPLLQHTRRRREVSSPRDYQGVLLVDNIVEILPEVKN